jgi:hypothetical protein
MGDKPRPTEGEVGNHTKEGSTLPTTAHRCDSHVRRENHFLSVQQERIFAAHLFTPQNKESTNDVVDGCGATGLWATFTAPQRKLKFIDLGQVNKVMNSQDAKYFTTEM